MNIMETIEQDPWIEYLEIKRNGKRKLKRNAPKEIKKAYKLYLKDIKKCKKQNIPIAK